LCLVKFFGGSLISSKYKILGRWLSILAIIFVSLMPLITQSFEKDHSNNYQVICSSSGLKLIDTNEGGLINSEIKQNINHCSYCTFLIDEDVLETKADKFQNSFIFFNINAATSFLSFKQQNILEHNYSQAPPSIKS
tara:strand:+ start:54 stop:464 length:411 start_codon:yes stop_codon:yes gene_type:complete